MVLGAFSAPSAATFLLAIMQWFPLLIFLETEGEGRLPVCTLKKENKILNIDLQITYSNAPFSPISSPDLHHTLCVLTCQGCSGPSEVKSKRSSLISKGVKSKMGVCTYQSALLLLSKLEKTQKLCTHKQWEEKCHLSPLQETKNNTASQGHNGRMPAR